MKRTKHNKFRRLQVARNIGDEIMKKITSVLLFVMLSTSVAFADIISTPWPGPTPAPKPEPEDDGEVVVIKSIICGILIVMMAYAFYKKSKKVSE